MGKLGETRNGVGKSGVLEHKSGNISLKRVKIEEKLLWWAYRNSPTLLGFATPPKTVIAIISGMGKATDFRFGQYIQRVHPNKKLLKILEKKSVGV